jgi:large subunit ribosomal protein L23
MNPERVFTVLVEPHFSEKASILGDEVNQYAFKVARDATKKEIKEAVETLFSVTVEKVTTLNVKGKVKHGARGVSRKKVTSW